MCCLNCSLNVPFYCPVAVKVLDTPKFINFFFANGARNLWFYWIVKVYKTVEFTKRSDYFSVFKLCDFHYSEHSRRHKFGNKVVYVTPPK